MVMCKDLLHKDNTFICLGEDFVGGQFVLTLLPGQKQKCINITLIDDDTALEGREMFRVELSTLFFPVPIDISTAEVTIIDNDSKKAFFSDCL